MINPLRQHEMTRRRGGEHIVLRWFAGEESAVLACLFEKVAAGELSASDAAALAGRILLLLRENELRQFIVHLRASGAKVWVEESSLRVHGPPALLGTTTCQFLEQHKKELIALVRQEHQDGSGHGGCNPGRM